MSGDLTFLYPFPPPLHVRRHTDDQFERVIGDNESHFQTRGLLPHIPPLCDVVRPRGGRIRRRLDQISQVDFHVSPISAEWTEMDRVREVDCSDRFRCLSSVPSGQLARLLCAEAEGSFGIKTRRSYCRGEQTARCTYLIIYA